MTKNTIYFHTAPSVIRKMCHPLNAPSKEYVCVQFLYCGICGGDFSYYLGRRSNYPVSLGHELIGKIISIGENVKTLKKGTYVITDFNYRCGQCEYCVSDRSHLCIKNDISFFSNRGFAQYANIHNNYLYPVSNLEWWPRACLIEPLSCVLHALQKFRNSLNTPILLCGGGSIGMLFCFYLTRVLHFHDIYIIEKNVNRINNLVKCFQINKYDINDNMFFDTVIDCTNSIDGVLLALNLIKRGGNICIMSHLYGLNTSFIYENICKKELNATFPLRNGNSENIIKATEFIQKLWTKDDDCMIQLYNNIENAFEEKEYSPCNKQVIDLSGIV